MSRQPITTNLFPEIRAHLQDDPDLIDHLQIPCYLCGKTLSLDYSAPEAQYCRGIAVLACGHCIGASCFRQFSEAQDPGFNVCPVDGVNLVYRGCRHDAHTFHFTEYEDIFRIPGCFHEGGQRTQLPHHCTPCRWHGTLWLSGIEFQLHIPRHLRWAIQHELVFSLQTSNSDCINLDCMMQNTEDDEDEASRMDVDISRPAYAVSQDGRELLSNGEPSITFPCRFLQIMRRSMIRFAQEIRGRWRPMVNAVEIGIRTPVDEISQNHLNELRESIATIHERSEYYMDYVHLVEDELEIAAAQALQAEREEARRMASEGPHSDTSSSHADFLDQDDDMDTD